jgi:hypothetical protein
MKHGLLEKLIVTQLVSKSPTVYETQKFITMFTKACHWFLCWAHWIQFTPFHLTSLKSTLILPSHISLACYMPYPSHWAWFHSNNIWWKHINYDTLHYAFSLTSCDFYPIRSKYCPKHPVLKYLQFVWDLTEVTTKIWHVIPWILLYKYQHFSALIYPEDEGRSHYTEDHNFNYPQIFVLPLM